MLNPFTLLEKYMDPVYQIVRLANMKQTNMIEQVKHAL